MTRPRVPAEAFPIIVALAGNALLFLSFAAITSNTANIFAWGFDGLSSLGESGVVLFVYELVHTTAAYAAFLAGLWLVGLAALILYLCRFIEANRVRTLLWMIWGLGIVSFIACSAVLFTQPDSSYASRYWAMLVVDPFSGEDAVSSRYRFWFLALPAVVALVFLFPKLSKILGAGLAILQTLPLFVAPFALANYLSRHFLCFAEPDVYSEFLNILTPFLFLVPAGLVTYRVIKSRRA